MSAFTPTLIPSEPHFPRLLPKPPQPHLVPLPAKRVYAHLNAFRDIQREMDDLSDEENELEDLVNASLLLCYLLLIYLHRIMLFTIVALASSYL